FGSSQAERSVDLIAALLAQGKATAAFQILEESRAQALLQLLAERHLDLQGVPTALQIDYHAALAARDLARYALDQGSIAQVIAQRELHQATENTAPPAERTAKQSALESAMKAFAEAQSSETQARLKADQLWAQIRRRTPRAFAAPLSLDKASRVLPPGI